MRIGRRKQTEESTEIEIAETATTPEIDVADDADQAIDEVAEIPVTDKSAPEDRPDNGPLDETEANPVRPYVDLGGVKILPREGLHLRLEIEEGSKRVVAVGLDFGESTLQVQPFAAPRSTGLWHEIRAQIGEQIERQGGTATEIEGPFGPELRADDRPASSASTGRAGSSAGSSPARPPRTRPPRTTSRSCSAASSSSAGRRRCRRATSSRCTCRSRRRPRASESDWRHGAGS